MSTAYQEDISTNVLRRMKEGGFDFSRFHPIEFYAIFPDEERARRAAGRFRGESLNAQVSARDDGAWYLELSKIMFATYDGIGDFKQDFEAVVEPLGGIIEGWGVKQEVRGLPMQRHEQQHSVSADLWVGRFCFWRGKNPAQKKATRAGWPKGRSQRRRAIRYKR